LNSSGCSFKFFGICEGVATPEFMQMTNDLGGKLTPQVNPSELSTHLVAVLNSFNRQ